MPEPITNLDVVALRPFVPSRDFQTSLRFYQDLGFTPKFHGENLATMQLGPFGFLLQDYYDEAFAGHFMMHLTVNDLPAWWRRIEQLDLAARYGVSPPKPPVMQPWGLVVAYVVDPSGVLWHIAENRTVN